MEIEKIIGKVFSIDQFRYVAKELKMTVEELSDYPLIFPVKRECYFNYTSSGYGMRLNPVCGVIKNHTGIDIAEPGGNPVYATGNGIVEKTGYEKGYGNFVMIAHRAGFVSFYAHLDKVLVAIGDTVTMGEHIADVGNTGISTGNHLHYEVRKDGKFLNPLEWCRCLMEMAAKEMDEDL